MINVSANASAAINGDSRRFSARFLLDGKVIDGSIKHITVNKGSCGDTDFVPGALYSSFIDAVVDYCPTALEKKELQLQFGVLVGDDYEWSDIGFYTVVTPATSAYTTSFTAIGRLGSKAGRLYVSELSYPATIKVVLDEISEQIGVSIDASEFDTSGVINTKPSGYMHREMLAYIASIFFGYVTETADGQIRFGKFQTEDIAETDGDRTTQLPTFADYDTEVTGVSVTTIVPKDDGSAEETKFVSGVVSVAIENPFMTQALFDANIGNIIGFKYRSGSVPITMGDYRLEPFDCMEVSDIAQNTYLVPCMHVQHVFDGGMITYITAPTFTGEDDTSQFKGSLTKKMERYEAELVAAKQIIAKKVTADEVEALVGDFEFATIKDLNATNATINSLNGQFATFKSTTTDTLNAQDASIKALTAKDAEIESLVAKKASIESLNATNAVIEKVVAEKATITDLNAATAKINALETETATIKNAVTENLTATNAEIASLKAKDASIDELIADKASVDDLNAVSARVGTLETDALKTANLSAEVAKLGYATVTNLDAATARITTLESTTVKASELESTVGTFGYLKANTLETEVAKFGYLKTAELEANVADFGYLKAASLSTEVAKLGYATVRDLNAEAAKITALQTTVATIEKAYMDEAKVESLVVGKGYLTEANAENLYAEKATVDELSGDYAEFKEATTGTLSAQNASIESLTAKDASIEALVAKKATITELNAAKARIADIEADYITSEALSAESANIQELFADYTKTTDLVAKYATIASLNTTNANVTNLTSKQAEFETATARNFEAVNADIESIQSDYVKTSTLEANYITAATIASTYVKTATLEANYITAAKIASDYVATATLEANYITASEISTAYATITSLNAAKADISSLTTKVGSISTLMFGSATGSSLTTEFSNSVVALIGNAKIKSAMIESIVADKITSGSINTDNVTIKSSDGSMVISDNTIQIKDGSTVRVQIGKDASNDYSISVWDSSGNLVFSEGGITENAIKSAIIRNDMVSDNANISASKLDIDSLFTEINGSTNTIKSTQIYLDDKKQTLDVAFSSLSTTVSDQGTTISSQGTAISTIQGQISSKIWQQDITSVTSGLDDRLTTQESNYSTLSQTVSGLSSTVASHTSQIANKADSSTVTTVSTKVTAIEQDLSGFKTTVSSTYASKAELETEVNKVTPFIAGTQTAKTGSWTGVAPFATLEDGQQITYWLPYDGSGNATLNLTLSDGTTTGAVYCYYKTTTRLTTHFGAGSAIRLTYRKNVSIGTGTYTGWWADAHYDSNTYDRVRHTDPVISLDALTKSKQYVMVGTSAGYKKAAAGVSFNIEYPVLAWYYSSAVAANATTPYMYTAYPSVSLRNNVASWSGTQYAMAYLVGTLNGTTFTISENVFTSTVPTAKDGLAYIPIGILSSAYVIYFRSDQTVYAYGDSGFAPVSINAQKTVDALKTNVETNYSTKSEVQQTQSSILSTVSSTYATQASLNIVDAKFSNYSTTAQMNSAIDQKADSITSTVSNTYATKESLSSYATQSSLDETNTAVSNLKTNVETNYASKSEVSQTQESILSTVSTNYATKSELTIVDGKFADYSTTSQMNSAISQKADSITQTVSQTYATKSALETTNANVTNAQSTADSAASAAGTAQGDVDALKARVSTAESSITQNADQIALKVSKDGVISAINQSAETVQIQAGKINLTGAVTISALDTSLSTTISDASSNASSALSKATTAISDSASAVETANSARSTASTASTNATDALAKANTAISDSASAVETANTANSNASTALSTASTAKSTADSVNSVIANWCYNNDTTYIDGGNIYTGTITAAKIAAGAITTEKLSAGAVTADKIDVNDLFAQNIVATGTISGATIKGGIVNGARFYAYDNTDGVTKSIEINDFTLTQFEGGSAYSRTNYFQPGSFDIYYESSALEMKRSMSLTSSSLTFSNVDDYSAGTYVRKVYISAYGSAEFAGNVTAPSFIGNASTATALATARSIQVNLGSTSSASFDGTVNVTPGIIGTLAIENGGTGATTAAGVLTNLGLTATATELNYMDGVTSNIQTQLDGKAAASHTHSYLPLSGGTMTGTLNMTANTVQLNFRPGHATYDGIISYQTGGNEAMVFTTMNAVTSFMFVNGEATATNLSSTRWQSLTPGLQIKNNCVTVNKLIANGVTPSYTLEVGGTIYASSTIYEGGTALSSKYAPLSHTHAYLSSTPTCIELNSTGALANYGGFIDFHFNGSTADYTSRIIENASGTLSVNGVTVTTGKVVTATTFVGALSGNATSATTAATCTGNAATATKATNDGNGRQIDRIYCSMIPAGTAIPANADLNTTTYLKVGNYYCASNATAKTLYNCPLTTYGSDGVGTAGSAFMMQVYSPLSTTMDNETTGTWVYRIRKIIHYNTGVEYTQYCYVGATAGADNWVYGDWYVMPRSKFTFNKTSASTAAIGSSTRPVYISSAGDVTACSAVAIAYGGTGAATVADARTNLDVYSKTEVDSKLSGKANSSHSHSEYAASSHTHSYLPLSGGTISGASGDTPLYAKSAHASSSYIGFQNSGGTTMGYLGFSGTNVPAVYVSGSAKTLLHAGNYNSYAAPKQNGIYYIEGTGSTAGTWLGSHDEIDAYYAGLVIAYKIPVAGASSTTLNINSLGAVKVVRNVTTAISTVFAVQSVVILIYTVDTSGTAYWKVADYDANTQIRVYRQTTGYNADYPLLISRTAAASIATAGSNSSYSSVYGVMWDDTTLVPTLNPSTGLMKVAGMNITGNHLTFDTGATQSATKGIKWSAINSKNPYIGYATDQTDGTFVVASLLGTSYSTGLAIGGGSGNLLYKANVVLHAGNYTSYCAKASHTHSLSDLGAVAKTAFTQVYSVTTFTSSTSVASTGVTVTIPAGSYYCITATALYINSQPLEIRIRESAVVGDVISYNNGTNTISTTATGYTTTAATTLTIYAKYASAASNTIRIMGFYVTP